MTRSHRSEALKDVARNIARSGFHIYLVSPGVVPRFAYTIGLRDSIGTELVLAGAASYMVDDVAVIIHALRDQLAQETSRRGPFAVKNRGRFTLRSVHSSWAEMLLLGANDYYGVASVDARQVIPDSMHRTIDVPDMSHPWSGRREKVWQWMREPWPYPVPADSDATTNLKALHGSRITEVTRWDDGWEMFAGAGPDVADEDMRVVPLSCLLAADPSLEPAVHLKIGDGLWRAPKHGDWHPWGRTHGRGR